MIKQILFLFCAVTMLAACSAKVTTSNSTLVNLQSNMVAVDAYYSDGQYEADVAALAAQADTYLERTLQSGKYEKPAIIFDIDDTLLDNHTYYKRTGYRFVSASWQQWINMANIPAVAPMQALYTKYLGKVDIFIITGRNVLQRAQTIRNLRSKGYDKWTGLFYKEAWDRDLKALPFKSRILTQLMEKDGYQIIANFGDQESDFGVEIQGKNFKLPNYLYITK